MTSITWAGPRCVQELGTFLAPQNRTQGRCEFYIETFSNFKAFPISVLCHAILKTLTYIVHWILDTPWIGISDIRAHPKYTVNKPWTTTISYQYDIAMVKLKERILDPDPHPDDVIVDTIRPICLPDYTTYGESDIPIHPYSYLYNKLALKSRSLNTREAKISSYHECKDKVYIQNDFAMDQ